jgi:uncharacterized protein
MKLACQAILGIALLVAVAAPVRAQTPECDGEFFTDLTHEVTASQKVEISRTLRKAAESSRVHPMLVVVRHMSDWPSLPQDASGFATQLAQEWKVGEASTHQGVLALFAIGDRQFFVARTSNVSQGVSDTIAAGFRGRTSEALKSGDVGHAMTLAAESIAVSLPAAVSGRVVTTTTRHSRVGGDWFGFGTILGILFAIWILQSFVNSWRGWGWGRSYDGYGNDGWFSGFFWGSMFSNWGSSSGSSWTDTTTTWFDSGSSGGGFDSFGGGSFDGGGSGGSW